jgi:hypothetical protein
MLYWAVVFLVVGIVADVSDFGALKGLKQNRKNPVLLHLISSASSLAELVFRYSSKVPQLASHVRLPCPRG